MPARWLGIREGVRPHVSVRERLIERVDRARAARVLWVVGEDGLGKSTLLAAYAARSGRPCLWLDLGAADADPGMFIAHFAANLRAAGVPAGMAPAHSQDVLAFARRFFSQAFATLPADTLIVLDGCEHAASAPVFPLLLREAMAVTPAGTQWCLIDAEPACEDFAYLVTLFEGDRIGPAEFRLDPTDVTAMLPSAQRTDADLAARLLEASAGSIGALRLLMSGGMAAGLWPTGADTPRARFIACAQTFLSQQSERVREALILLALPDRVTDDMLENTIRESAVQRLLRAWMRKDLVLHTSGDGWRVQPLIRSVILQMAAAHWNGSRLRDLSHALARHCERRGFAHEAIRLYGNSVDWEAAAALVLRESEAELEAGRWARVRSWIEAMPDTAIERTPLLRFWLGRALAPLDPELARLCFRRAQAQFEHGSDAAGEALSLAGLLEIALSRPAVETQLADWVIALDVRLAQAQRWPSRTMECLAARTLLTAALWSTTAPAGLAACARRLHELLGAVEIGPDARLSAATALLEYYDISGHPELASRVVDMAAADVQAGNTGAMAGNAGAVACAAWHCAAGLHHMLAGSPVAARAALDAAVNGAGADGLRELELRARLRRAMLRICQGQPGEAQEDLEALRGRARARDPAEAAGVAIVAASLARMHGNVAEALQQAQHFARSAAEALPRHMLLLWGVVAAEIQLEHGGDGAADALIAQLDRRSQAFVHAPWRLAAELLRAEALRRRGEGLRCRESLVHALALYRENPAWASMLRPVPGTMARVLDHALAQGVDPGQAERLIADLELEAPSRVASDWPWRARVRVLGNSQAVTGGEQRRLLGALVAAGEDGLSERVLREVVFGVERRPRSHGLLARALTRLGEQLGSISVIRRRGARWRLSSGHCWVDAWAFAELVGRDPARALALYRGRLLPGVEGEALQAVRNSLHARYVDAVMGYAQDFEMKAQHEAALALYQAGIEIDGGCESFYQGVMRCELELGRVDRARRAYDLLSGVLGAGEGERPSGVTEALRKRIESRERVAPGSSSGEENG